VIANVTDLEAPYQNAGALFSSTPTRSTARRLHRTRQHLGSYRHDLVVAMRVVNSIEREMMQAEWENWLLDENTRCKQVQAMLSEDREGGLSSNSRPRSKAGNEQQSFELDEAKRSKLAKMRVWHEEYCGSCKLEQDTMMRERKHLAFG
jgi:hypothetical protein